jgi:hypothetical protein
MLILWPVANFCDCSSDRSRSIVLPCLFLLRSVLLVLVKPFSDRYIETAGTGTTEAETMKNVCVSLVFYGDVEMASMAGVLLENAIDIIIMLSTDDEDML